MTSKKVEDIKKDFLSKLQRQNASLLSSSLDDDLVPDMTVLDPEMMSKIYYEFFDQKLIFNPIFFPIFALFFSDGKSRLIGPHSENPIGIGPN